MECAPPPAPALKVTALVRKQDAPCCSSWQPVGAAGSGVCRMNDPAAYVELPLSAHTQACRGFFSGLGGKGGGRGPHPHPRAVERPACLAPPAQPPSPDLPSTSTQHVLTRPGARGGGTLQQGAVHEHSWSERQDVKVAGGALLHLPVGPARRDPGAGTGVAGLRHLPPCIVVPQVVIRLVQGQGNRGGDFHSRGGAGGGGEKDNLPNPGLPPKGRGEGVIQTAAGTTQHAVHTPQCPGRPGPSTLCPLGNGDLMVFQSHARQSRPPPHGLPRRGRPGPARRRPGTTARPRNAWRRLPAMSLRCGNVLVSIKSQSASVSVHRTLRYCRIELAGGTLGSTSREEAAKPLVCSDPRDRGEGRNNP